MKKLYACLSVIAASLSPVMASFHLWDDREIFSTADGRVQYIEFFTSSSGQEFLSGQTLRSVSADGSLTNNYVFPGNSGSPTTSKALLIATPGFSQLPGGVTPDFTVPAGFLFQNGGSVTLISAAANQSWASGQLPLNGKSSWATPGLTTNASSPQNLAGTVGSITMPGAGSQQVYFEGLYHNNANLNAQTELIPLGASPTNRFLELDYVANRANFYYLTASPAGDGQVSTRVRLYPAGNNGNFEDFAAGELVATVTIATTNQFHATPSSGVVTVDVWRARWTPPANYTGTVYYVPQVQVSTTGSVTDTQSMLSNIGTNQGSTNFGVNSYYWSTNAQAFGREFFALDYSFAWTNLRPATFDTLYFNSTGAVAPEAESVPGLGGTTFFNWNYATNQPSHAYVIAPASELTSLSTRFFFTGGPGEIIRTGTFYTNAVISSGTPFHGLPVSGDLTVQVWRTEFWPPSGWTGSVFYAHQISTLRNGSTWMVRNDGSETVTNNWIPPQLFTTNGPFGRDWSFTPTGAITRTSLNRDYAYINNAASFDPQTEGIPETVATNFLEVNYATTTTTFYVMTPHFANVVPNENVELQMRISWSSNNLDNYVTEYPTLQFNRNLIINSGTPFHGLPVSGSFTADLWEVQWRQPTNSAGAPLTNAITVYFAPLLKTTVGSGNYQTDYTYLLKAISGGPGFGSNNYPIAGQLYGPDNFGNDYSYVNQWVAGADGDGDGIPDAWELLYFGTTTNGASGDNDGDELDNIGEYVADTVPTNSASFFGVITNFTRLSGVVQLTVNPSSTGRVYDAYVETNLVNGSGWMPYGLAVPGNGGFLQLTVTNTLNRANYRTGVRLP